MTSDTPGAGGSGDDGSTVRSGGSDPLRVRSRSRWPVRVAWILAIVGFAALAAYVTTHPEELATSESVVRASTPVDRKVYVGVFQADGDFGRTIRISGVKVYAESTVPVTITSYLCAGGSVGVTSDLDLFCTESEITEGASMSAGDEIVLEVVGDQPGVVTIDRIEVAYRDRLQWDTQPAGSPAVVTILSR